MIGFHSDGLFSFEDRDLPDAYADFVWEQIREVQLALSEVVPNTFLNMNHRSIESVPEKFAYLNHESEKIISAWAALEKRNHPPFLRWVEDRFSRYLQSHFTDELQNSAHNLLTAASIWNQTFWVSLLNLRGRTLHLSLDKWVLALPYPPTELDFILMKSLLKTLDLEFEYSLDKNPATITFDRKHE